VLAFTAVLTILTGLGFGLIPAFQASRPDLQSVLKDLPRQVKIQQRDVEVSVVLVGLAMFLLLLAVWAAVRWTTFPT